MPAFLKCARQNQENQNFKPILSNIKKLNPGLGNLKSYLKETAEKAFCPTHKRIGFFMTFSNI